MATSIASRRPGSMSTRPDRCVTSGAGSCAIAAWRSAQCRRSARSAMASSVSSPITRVPAAMSAAPTAARGPRRDESGRASKVPASPRKPAASNSSPLRWAMSPASGSRGRMSDPGRPRLATPEIAGNRYSGALKMSHAYKPPRANAAAAASKGQRRIELSSITSATHSTTNGTASMTRKATTDSGTAASPSQAISRTAASSPMAWMSPKMPASSSQTISATPRHRPPRSSRLLTGLASSASAIRARESRRRMSKARKTVPKRSTASAKAPKPWIPKRGTGWL